VPKNDSHCTDLVLSLRFETGSGMRKAQHTQAQHTPSCQPLVASPVMSSRSTSGARTAFDKSVSDKAPTRTATRHRPCNGLGPGSSSCHDQIQLYVWRALFFSSLLLPGLPPVIDLVHSNVSHQGAPAVLEARFNRVRPSRAAAVIFACVSLPRLLCVR